MLLHVASVIGLTWQVIFHQYAYFCIKYGDLAAQPLASHQFSPSTLYVINNDLITNDGSHV